MYELGIHREELFINWRFFCFKIQVMCTRFTPGEMEKIRPSLQYSLPLVKLRSSGT